ncbi:MAG TPA: ABC transporter substrate-binding protein [Solirubrobacteraceae bacterium]|nr:ABC transporter substrate-binding protein [Solirubrobacteraceae bacterium]
MLASLALSACGGDDDDDASSQSASGGTQEVEVLLSFPRGNAWLPLLVAEDQGYFEDEGLRLKIQETEGSGFVTQQIIAGNADFGWAGAPSDVIAYGKDPSLRALACNHEKNIFSINVPAGSDIQSVADLDGRKLGITAKGGGEEPMVNSVLAENDLDVEVIPVGEVGPAVIKAIKDGTVDAFAGGITDITTLEASGIDFTDITPEQYDPMPGDCLVSTQKSLEDEGNQDVAAKMIRAWMKGAFFAIASPDAAVDIACRTLPEECQDREGFTAPFAKKIIDIIQPVDSSLPPTALDPAGWEQTAKVLLTSGALENEVDVDTLIASPEGKAVTDKAYADVDAVKAAAEDDAAAYQPEG